MKNNTIDAEKEEINESTVEYEDILSKISNLNCRKSAMCKPTAMTSNFWENKK